jgi:protein-S-isoprenylcysteine O-methyltransferase Ste14
MTSFENAIGVFIVSHRRGWEYFCNSILGLSALLFNYVMLVDFFSKHRASSLYVAVFEAAVVYFAVSRPMPKESNRSLYDWTIALTGSFIILLLRPAPQVHDHVPILIVQVLGMLISLTALLSLNKSFGLVAVNRGVKTRGMYRVIRHPIYAGYFLSFGAYLIQNMTSANAAIYGLFVTLELLRVAAEERVLSQDPDYTGYMRNTRWRVLPLVY